MKRTELTGILQKEYRKGLPCGVAKVKEKGFENIWFVVPPPPPEHPPRQLPLKALAQAHRTLEKLPDLKDATELDRLTSYLFIRREAIQSSRIEGTWSTIDAILSPGELHDHRGKSATTSILGYAHVLEKEIDSCRKKGPALFTESLVTRIHKAIMEREPRFEGRAGQIRLPNTSRSVVFIGGLGRKEDSIYNPVPPQHVRRCLKEVLKWLSDDLIIELGDAGQGMSLPLRMAIGHSHFEAVHPFSDGNGRVGRILMMLQMAVSGKLPLYISGFIETRKSDYVKALAEAQKKLNYSGIIEFVCEAIVASYEEAEQTKSSILALPEDWQKRGLFREKSAAKRILPFLIKHPIFMVKHVQSELQVSGPAAHRAVDNLIQTKVVHERTGYGRNRVFAAEEVIQLLAREFGASPTTALKAARKLMGL